MFPNTKERYGGWEHLNGTKTNSHEIRVQSESNMTNQEKWQLIQFESKTMHKWTMGNLTHETHHGLDLGESRHSPPYSIMIWLHQSG